MSAPSLRSPAPALAAFPGNNGKIAYSCGSGGAICVVNPDGTQKQTLTPIAGTDPAWSPDGTKIAFSGNSGNNAEIFVMQADGTLLTPLTANQFADQDPAWSPDGQKIVFTSNRADPNAATCGSSCLLDLFVMNADGSQPTRLTPGRTDLRQLDPSWEPNGARIAFYCENQSFWRDICLVNQDGTGRVQLGPGEHPNWLPDGSRIAFDAAGQDSRDIFTMNPDGSGRALVTTNSATINNREPAWSPDGAKFADTERSVCFTGSGCAGILDQIAVRNADGTNPVGPPPEPANSNQPDWQPLPPTPYPRPSGASPVHASLVPAYAACASPNRVHGPPLAHPSCNPPAPASQQLTVGTVDANGQAANSVGSLRLAVIRGIPPRQPTRRTCV